MRAVDVKSAGSTRVRGSTATICAANASWISKEQLARFHPTFSEGSAQIPPVHQHELWRKATLVASVRLSALSESLVAAPRIRHTT